jgi:hypothetical protein
MFDALRAARKFVITLEQCQPIAFKIPPSSSITKDSPVTDEGLTFRFFREHCKQAPLLRGAFSMEVSGKGPAFRPTSLQASVKDQRREFEATLNPFNVDYGREGKR